MRTYTTSIVILAICLAAGAHVRGADLPMFGPLPNPGKNWKLREQGTNGTLKYGWSWVVFTNSLSGDLMSFAAQNIGSKAPRRVAVSGWSDTAGEIFPGGYPVWVTTPERPAFTGHYIRNNLIRLTVGDGLLKTNISQDALEYTIVFAEDLHGNSVGTNRLAHGYALGLGALGIFVQHTSTKPITPEDASDMAHRLMTLHAHREAARNSPANPSGKERLPPGRN